MSAHLAAIPDWPTDTPACAACADPIVDGPPVVRDEFVVCPTCEAALTDPVAVLRRAYEAEDAASYAAAHASRMQRLAHDLADAAAALFEQTVDVDDPWDEPPARLSEPERRVRKQLARLRQEVGR